MSLKTVCLRFTFATNQLELMIPQTGNEAFLQIVNRLVTECYTPIVVFCDRIDMHLKQFESKALFVKHVNYSGYLSGEIKSFVQQRISVFVPYLLELSEKSTTGHDCANCSGRCDMQHALKLMEFTNTLRQMQSTSSYIQTEFAALDTNKESDDDALTWLRKELRIVSNLLDELLRREEMLIPDIQYAQKNINAHS